MFLERERNRPLYADPYVGNAGSVRLPEKSDRSAYVEEAGGMAGWSAVAGEHEFIVPDRARAESLAEALAAYGFSWVTAKSFRGQWFVTAADEGPYRDDVAGYRTINAVGRAAGVLAREYGGYLVASCAAIPA